MARRAARTSIAALVPPGDRAVLARAAAASGVDVEMVETLSDLLRRLATKPRSATFVSLSVDPVDEGVVERLGLEPAAGTLLVSTGAISLPRVMALRNAGASGLLREPLAEVDVGPLLRGLEEEGEPVPIAAADAGAGAEEPPVLVGESPAMSAVFDTVARVAGSTATVLLTGESGTGKEVVARALHWASPRAAGPFVAVNCAAIPEQLLETELFGHERGAFTGAVVRKMGRFERAHGGTLFLDEIGDMSLVLQAKVLRVLEDRTVERVGSESGREVDVRVIAATNQDLATATRDRRFREDLYHRLAVVNIHLPPLRARGGDVRSLALHFAAHFARKHGKPIRAITERALSRVEAGVWPGNVRELRNVMDRAVVLASGPIIRSDDLKLGSAAPVDSAHAAPHAAEGYLTTRSLAEVEWDHIHRVLEAVGGQMGLAADTLGIHRNTLTRKLKLLGLERHAGKGSLS